MTSRMTNDRRLASAKLVFDIFDIVVNPLAPIRQYADKRYPVKSSCGNAGVEAARGRDVRSAVLQQRLPIDLSGPGLGEFARKFDYSGIFERKQLALHVVLQHARRF